MENIKSKTKLDLITGFLGAGKTTFIRRYAQWLQSKGVTFCVIENEFGTAGVDTAILRENSINISELTGGCICCSLKVNFHNMLVELAEHYDRIIVEPSGIFDIEEFFDVVRSPEISRLCDIGCVVTVIDPGALGRMEESERGILHKQLLYSGRILLSKTQKLPADITGRAVKEMNKGINMNGTMRDIGPIVENCNWEKLTDEDYYRISTSKPVFVQYKKSTRDHTLIFNSTTLYPEKVFTRDELLETLEDLSVGDCGTVLRVKGYISSADGHIFSVNCTPSDILVEPMKGDPAPMLNIIGRNLRRSKISALFK